jgi:hypothetical protein
VAEADGRTVINHGGSAVVMSSWTILDTATGTAASVLYNGPPLDAYRYPGQLWLVNNLLHIANGEPLSHFGRPTEADPTRNAFEPDDANLDRYTGRYLSADGFSATITRSASGTPLLLSMDAGAIRIRAAVDFASASSAVLRTVTGATPVAFTITRSGQVTGLSGGLPGGAFRKRSVEELARTRESRSPDGRIGLQLPRDWVVHFRGSSFAAQRGADTTTRLAGTLTAATASLPSGQRMTVRSETIGRYQWMRRTWTDASTRQRTRIATRVGSDWFELDASVPAGRLTAALRDVIVPLLSTIDLQAER